ncbi:hypothetical protein G6F54_000895 [Rhizopus delemar]|nr:hypothetical protein G6F54_000895 [Rhizopus delemar]
MEESNVHIANHILESVIKDLSFLKDNNFLNIQTYQEVISLLPAHLSAENNSNVPRPPLPIRKSTSSTTNQSREVINNSLPKLPVRRTNDWSQQPIKLPSPVINPRQPEPEKVIAVPTTAPPPAYTENNSSIATVEALYDYNGEDPTTDLSFKQGDIIEVTEYVNDDWWKGAVNGKTGIFPQNHVKKIPPPIKAKRPQPPSKPNTTTMHDNNTPTFTPNQPYVYPPPPTTLYQPPPPSQPYNVQSYAPPPIQAYTQQPQQPVAVQQEEEKENKVSNLTKKFGGQVATAATWGFGATLGSQAANLLIMAVQQGESNGTRVSYDRPTLLALAGSPFSKLPPVKMAFIPGVTRTPNQSDVVQSFRKEKDRKKEKEKKQKTFTPFALLGDGDE